MRLYALPFVVAALSACARPSTSLSDSQRFFENSRRRAATYDERRHLVNVSGCTGFYVQNTSGQTVVATAGHCLGYAAVTWCRTGSVRDEATSAMRSCQGVVAGDGDHDVVLLAFDGTPPDAADTYELAAFAPAEKTRLTLLGYPADPYATGGAMATEDCWVHASSVSSPYAGTDYWDKGLKDLSFTHNCSTYGGNSGGPLVIEGTRTVVGLPFTYDQGVYTNHVYTDFAYGAQVADVVRSQASALARYGVSVRYAEPASAGGAYFKAARYVSSSIPGCAFSIIPLYLTSNILTKLSVSWSGSACGNGSGTYDCADDRCTYSGTTISDMSAYGFTYTASNGSRSAFWPE